MFSINEFLNYATDGNVSAPAPKPRKTAPQIVKNRYTGPVLISTLVSPVKRTALPSGPIMVHTYQPEPKVDQCIPPVLPSTTKSQLEIVNYSERSFAIFGDTKPIKGQLEVLGGKFNKWLRKDGIPTPGYIFSIGRRESVRKTLSL